MISPSKPLRERPFVNHWRYEDGWKDIPVILRDSIGISQEFDECFRGWHCWVFTVNDLDFDKWMEENMIGEYHCDFRFNDGNPLYNVIITNDEDATLFKLTWM